MKHLREFSTWFLVTVCVLAFAGFIGILQLQRAISHTRSRQTTECQAVAALQQSVLKILGSFETDPATSAQIKSVIAQQAQTFTRALEASHHCS